MQKFLRHVELEITFANDAREIISTETYISTGERDGLAISFSVEKTLVGQPNTSTVTIYNMAPSVRRKLVSNVRNTAIRLFANYEGEPRQLLTCGDLLRAWPEKEGPSNKMTLTFMDGLTAILHSFSRKYWPANTAIRTVVQDLALDLSSVGQIAVDPTKIIIDGIVPIRGLTVCGKTSSVLDDLSRQYGFTWSIQNQVFQAYKDVSNNREPSKRHFSVSVENRNLLKATPELGEKYMNMIGMKIEAILDARVICADIIDLVSSIYPEYSGTYSVHEVSFDGDTFGSDWKMTITSKQASPTAGE